MRLGQGRDCTALVLSYHLFSLPQVQSILAKYRVPDADQSKEDNSGSRMIPSRDAFYQVLCDRGEESLRKQGLDPKRDMVADNWRVAYYWFMTTLLLISGYYHVTRANICASIMFGITGWFMAALGHDAGHYSVSHHPWINDIGLWGASLIGNPITWQHQHTYAHHSFTNEVDADPDLHHYKRFLRVHRSFQ